MNNKTRFNDTYPVRSWDTGVDGKATIQALLRFMEDIAGNHAYRKGAGIEYLFNRGFTWVLSRMEVEFTEWPETRELIEGTTWPRGIERLFALRDFIFTSGDNKPVMKGTSSWLILDLEKRKPVRVDPFLEMFDLDETKALNGSAEKLNFEVESAPGKPVIVPNSALDQNNHVNNIYYIIRAMDSVPEELLRSCTIERIRINYMAECFAGDSLTVKTDWINDELFQIVFRGNQEACRIHTTWKNNR